MSSLEDLRQVRKEKIKKLEEAGFVSYLSPEKVKQEITLKEVNEKFSELEKNKENKSIAGRIMIKRGAGNIAFAKIFDGTGEFQVVLKSDVLGKEKMKVFEKLFDMGDFAEFKGTFFVTERGQESLLAEEFKMLTKALLPLPEKWHGLENIEEKYRKRYLDVLGDKEVFDRFVIRSKVISKIREILNEENFLEVETPILQNQASGAMAETFKTYHNDYDMEMVLRISLEAELKMIMAGGYPAVYEIGKNFRNEGSDSTHIQEFTMVEWYKAYKGLDYNLDLTEKMIKIVAKDVIGKTKFEITDSEENKVEIDLSGEWRKIKFNDLIKENTELVVESASREDIEEKALEFGFDKKEVSKISDGNLLDFIFKKSSRNKIIQPTFVTHYPASLKPLAIQNEDGTAEVAQLVIA
jgi:lysyl-tRNA synthetase class 2